MEMNPEQLQGLKAKMKATWMAGDFGKIGEFIAQEGVHFIERLKIKPGQKVLDVACGTGNLAIPAAEAGGEVAGVDIAPNLLEQARARAKNANLEIDFTEGDAEALPYDDESFDIVVSMYGAMFAPRPELVAKELLRVCRPGGLIAMANWTKEGLVGDMFAISGKYVPPPSGIPSPLLWADEEVVRSGFEAGASDIEFFDRVAELDYPFPPAEVVRFFRTYFGPTQTTFASLDEAHQTALAIDMVQLFAAWNRGPEGHTHLKAEYREVYVHKAYSA